MKNNKIRFDTFSRRVYGNVLTVLTKSACYKLRLVNFLNVLRTVARLSQSVELFEKSESIGFCVIFLDGWFLSVVQF